MTNPIITWTKKGILWAFVPIVSSYLFFLIGYSSARERFESELDFVQAKIAYTNMGYFMIAREDVRRGCSNLAKEKLAFFVDVQKNILAFYVQKSKNEKILDYIKGKDAEFFLDLNEWEVQNALRFSADKKC